MLSPSDWISLAAICALGAMTPGASLLVISRQALDGGYRAGLAAAWSHAAGIGLWALLSAFGLALVLHARPALATTLQLLAGVYLLWLALQLLRARHHAAAQQPLAQPSQRAALDGALISVLNPKVGLFFLAVFSPLLDANASAASRCAAAAMAALIDGGWYTLVTLMVARPAWRARLQGSHAQLALVSALAFGGFGLLALTAPWR